MLNLRTVPAASNLIFFLADYRVARLPESLPWQLFNATRTRKDRCTPQAHCDDGSRMAIPGSTGGVYSIEAIETPSVLSEGSPSSEVRPRDGAADQTFPYWHT
ncbi:uncharacterized protein MYCFIDRAFT_179068 [Pseudocercospora fijiensis CIRAD86]|uniref:Uncharacterized protein n=1 Tax=Pseudocercospora fijiensis (strain CIRAD86) TaxID=383855 RepID=M2YIF0_PSEFD|nr:uncharacterized protein MYCFIDRAFT_179068 [Pseudocercospora fijiensis CIRAD86]EME77550.1 hypothetical protein MYCFIDRAFT_179068 [Pseudocercospora fijiensis CIRAD86]